MAITQKQRDAVENMLKDAMDDAIGGVVDYLGDAESYEVTGLRAEIDRLNDCILRQQRELNRLKGCTPSGKVGAA